MKQSAADKPVHSYQRKAAIVAGGIADHSDKVQVKPIENFDLNRTIFNTLEGAVPRMVVQTRIAKDVRWQDEVARALDAEYEKKSAQKKLPPIDPKLIAFMKDECDFDWRHVEAFPSVLRLLYGTDLLKFSAKIGHDLKYELVYGNSAA
jgi:hypothetical protein